MSTQPLAAQVLAKLVKHTPELQLEFNRDRHPVKSRVAVLDNVLPPETVKRIYESYPPLEQMRLMNSFREQKYTSKALDRMDPIIREALYAFQTPEVLLQVEKITGIKALLADPSLYAGGISAMIPGQFLNPHIDNSHEATQKFYRRVNVLFYVTPDWSATGGGNLELWDTGVRTPLEIPSLFNRLVIMETNRVSWHSVNPVKQQGTRCCVSNYYFTEQSPEAYEYFHVTSFSARPEQPIARLVASADNLLRSCLRMIKKDGMAKKDVYKKAA